MSEQPVRRVTAAARTVAHWAWGRLGTAVGGAHRRHVVVVLACVLGLSSADAATVGASATQLKAAFGIGNLGIGLLVTSSALVGAVLTLPAGWLADRVRRVPLLAVAVASWGVAMAVSAGMPGFVQLLLARLALGAVTAAAGPVIASLVGDYFPGPERGRVYGFILAGELVGAGVGFVVSGDIAMLSWRAPFAVLAVPGFVLAWLVSRLPEPPRTSVTGPVDERSTVPAGDSAAQPATERVVGAESMTMSLLASARYTLAVPTNLRLVLASVSAYYFLAGVQTFGLEFFKQQFGLSQLLANVLLPVLGICAVLGVLVSGRLSDFLQRRFAAGRVYVAAGAATATAVLLAPALLQHGSWAALPYLGAAAFFLAAQNPPLDAARLDIMPALLWGRAESIRTALRILAQSLAPAVFGLFADHVMGGGHTGLQRTFLLMLLALVISAVLLFRAARSYPVDVATAVASDQSAREEGPTPPGDSS